jgi:glucose-6-phosphate isomerase
MKWSDRSQVDAQFSALSAQRQAHAHASIADLFVQDPHRFNEFSVSCDDLLLDYSKTALTRDSRSLLLDLAE